MWTNTCCSHPLHGMVPNEVDDAEHVQNGTVPGIRYAAVRKLKHELGLDGVDPTQFKFLTRLHYWAADTITHGTKSPWGEHEIDYVLFWVIPQKNDIQLKPNPEEIQSIRWVNAVELEDMLGQKDLLFSPWFRLIYYKWLKDCWWKDLKITMETDKWIDYQSIHEFDPPREHYGGQGDAKPLFECSRYDACCSPVSWDVYSCPSYAMSLIKSSSQFFSFYIQKHHEYKEARGLWEDPHPPRVQIRATFASRRSLFGIVIALSQTP